MDFYIPSVEDYSAKSQRQTCASTATLAINEMRSCAVWHNNRTVKAICGTFLLAMFAVGINGTYQGCNSRYVMPSDTEPGTLIWVGTMFQRVPIGIVACVFSLSTNLLATILIAYKTWKLRRRLKGYFVAKVGGSQVEKLLAFLIESDVVYCGIWSVAVAFQICEYNFWNDLPGLPSTNDVGFLNTNSAPLNGALVPAIAIYPVFITALVALNRSHIEKGFTQHLESLLTPHIAVTPNPTATSPRERRSYQRSGSEALVIDGEGLECGSREGLEGPDMGERRSEEAI